MEEVLKKVFDDLLYSQTGERVEAAESIVFEVDGVRTRIDLTADNAEAFRETVRPFVESGTTVTKRTGGSSKKKSSPPAAGTQGPTTKKSSSKDVDAENREIREWAQENGFELSPRGRIPSEVRNAWAQAKHGSSEVTHDKLTDEAPGEPQFDAIGEDNSGSAVPEEMPQHV